MQRPPFRRPSFLLSIASKLRHPQLNYNGAMYTSWYSGISDRFCDSASRRLLRGIDKILVFAVAIAYIATIVWMIVNRDMRLVKFFCVPAATFVIATLLRAAINAPRPYETYSISPILEADTKGKSLPSRHAASACVIACAFLWLNPIAGIICWIAAIAIAALRVIGGVHFARDVIAAAALAIAFAAIGFLAIP